MVTAAEQNEGYPASVKVVTEAPGKVNVIFTGAWTVSNRHPTSPEILADISSKTSNVNEVVCDFSGITEWDGIFHSLILKLIGELNSKTA